MTTQKITTTLITYVLHLDKVDQFVTDHPFGVPVKIDRLQISVLDGFSDRMCLITGIDQSPGVMEMRSSRVDPNEIPELADLLYREGVPYGGGRVK